MSNRKDLASDLAAIQDRLAGAPGPDDWRAIEELAETEAFQELLRREYPAAAARWGDAISRRKFLTLMGASLALAGLAGCSVKPAPSVELVPYSRPPAEIVPGRPLFFATTMTLGASAVGLLVESHMGRPTKIEGNPDHPASLGTTDAFHQASVLTLYDPDRKKIVTHLGQPRTWSDAAAALRAAIAGQRDRRGAGIRLLTETVISPTLAEQIEGLLKQFPEAKWHQYEPLHGDAAHRAAMAAFGEPVSMSYDFAKADVVLSLDADFLMFGPSHLRDSAQFMARRRVRTTEQEASKAEMNRLYAVETAVSCTGAKADHRLAVQAGQIEHVARAIATQLGIAAGGRIAEPHQKWAAAVAQDLQAHRGRALVLAGAGQPAAVHLLAHAMNQHLDAVGQTLFYANPIEARPVDQIQSLKDLVDDLNRGRVELLVILGGNPVFTAPADVPFLEALQKAKVRAHLSLYENETTLQCHWGLPETHYLEAWSDARAFDGTASIVQPLIAPLYQGRSAHEVLSLLAGPQESPGLLTVRSAWERRWEGMKKPGAFDDYWQTALHDGRLPDTAFPHKPLKLAEGWQKHLPAEGGPALQAVSAGQWKGGLEIVFQPDPTIYDGRFANNGWLQECPKPITKLTWDNAAIMSPATAEAMGLEPGRYAHGGEHGGYDMPVVELQRKGRTVRAPVWIMPGHADGSITVYLGYGRERAGNVGGNAEEPVGFNAYALRTSEQPGFAPDLLVAVTGDSHPMACTQGQYEMEGREIARAGTLDEYHRRPRFVSDSKEGRVGEEREREPSRLTLYESFDYGPPKHRWAMLIDLTTCIGCNACVIACQSENNVPVVGKEQVRFGRAMHWLRIDRYIEGPEELPSRVLFQPLPCMHCEKAPCEYVCPVEATVHSAEGLNDMIYNRCVGTRFCSNNCPYKVRRFNFYRFADFETRSRRLQYNPDVTVRSRGVMEKCTYCVQRIRRAEIDALKANRPIADGEVLTACQAACPTQAIVFGDLNDPESVVRRWRASPLQYGLLAGIGTEPRTRYLAALRNPNPELET